MNECKKYGVKDTCHHLQNIFIEDIDPCEYCNHSEDNKIKLCRNHFLTLDRFVKNHGPCTLECKKVNS